jgi:gliding motility-associated-like protein
VITGTGTETGTNFATGYSSNPEIGKGLSIADPVASPTATTTYYATVTNSKGFSTTASITVAVRDDYVVKPDNNFSPNGDGINDIWKVPNIENYPDHELTIFDRGGKLLYKTRSYQNTWDGTVNGEPLDEGTYYYIFNFDGQKGPIKGFITIVK